MANSLMFRALVLAAAFGAFACNDTCPKDPEVPAGELACDPATVGATASDNGSFEARPDALAGWTLLEAADTRIERLPGIDGPTAIALVPPAKTFVAPARLTRVRPAAALRGQRIRLAAHARVEFAAGGHKPVLAVHARTGTRQLVIDGASVRLKAGDWSLHSVEFDVPQDTDTLELVVMLAGARRVELDGFTLERIGPACPGCDPPAPLGLVEVDNLLAFTCLLGHVRYFYPGDEWSAADWNTFALVGVQEALRADSPTALAEAMTRVFQSHAPLLRIAAGTPVPDPAVPHTFELGRGLTAAMPLALAIASTRAPQASPVVLAKPEGFTANGGDRLTRLAAIAVLAARMTHFAPRVARHRAHWEDVLRDSFSRAAVAVDRFGVQQIVWRLFAAVDDVPGQAHVTDDVRLGYRLALRWAWIEDQVVVTEIDAARAPGLRVGDIVEAIDGRPVGLTIAEILAYSPGLTDARRHMWALSVLSRGLTGEPRALQVRRADGSPAVVPVPTVPVGLNPKRGGSPKIRDLAAGILYIDLARTKPDELRAAAGRIAGADAAVLDVRGGTSEQIRKLLGEPGDLVASVLLWPAGQHATVEPAPPAAPQPSDALALPKRLAVLIDAGCMSSTEPLIDFLRARHGATLVGTATAGGSMQWQTLALPGEVTVGFTEAVADYVSDHDPLTPIEPDIIVADTLADLRHGRDAPLERALAALQTGTPGQAPDEQR